MDSTGKYAFSTSTSTMAAFQPGRGLSGGDTKKRLDEQIIVDAGKPIIPMEG